MTIAELTEKILKEGYRITRENLDKELLLTAERKGTGSPVKIWTRNCC